jgi:hypothetical protein
LDLLDLAEELSRGEGGVYAPLADKVHLEAYLPRCNDDVSRIRSSLAV